MKELFDIECLCGYPKLYCELLTKFYGFHHSCLLGIVVPLFMILVKGCNNNSGDTRLHTSCHNVAVLPLVPPAHAISRAAAARLVGIRVAWYVLYGGAVALCLCKHVSGLPDVVEAMPGVYL